VERYLLAADVGGTKTLAALFALRGERLTLIRERRYASRPAPSVEALLAAFLAEGGERVALASLGVAGAVREGKAESANLPWPVEGEAVARALGLPRAVILNDVAAAALGMNEIGPEGFFPLQAGQPDPQGARALIAAGTGLGQALIPRRPPGTMLLAGRTAHDVLPSEGGHTDFAPADELEEAFLAELRAAHGHVSWERVVSAPGLVALHDFLVRTGRAELPPRVARRMAEIDPAAVIAEEGTARTDAGCRAALLRFVRAYGAAAGNLALSAMATGGVSVGGGIAPKILPTLAEGPFLEGFRAKGRLRPLMERIPVRVILEPRLPLLGAARRGAELLTGIL